MFLYAGGASPTVVNTIEFVTIATDGNAVDFGDAVQATTTPGTCCNAQGGL